MEITVTISIGGYAFHIEEEACKNLKAYLKAISATLKEEEGADEIMSDIESRIAEILMARPDGRQRVISNPDVEEIVKIMGSPDEFIDDARADESSQESQEKANYDRQKEYEERHRRFREQWQDRRKYGRYSGTSRVYRDTRNAMLGGVAAGLAAYWRLDPLIVRILFVFAALFSAGAGIIAYLVLWIVLPPAKTRAHRMSMRGEPITVENIKRSVRREYERVSKGFSRW